MEGIHLRGGAIARGGIRFSDRMDYRTEVYGLMRAQLTKNAIIVPAGAKGGFIVKRSPIDKATIEESYVTYIRSLLDVTDNLVDGEVVHPDARARARRGRHVPRGRRRQGHGDVLGHRQRGRAPSTASGSTTRSRPAARSATTTRSSGSPRAAPGSRSSATSASSGVDVARDEFTAVGIGDMSGDVFGNGMLLSDKIKLLAAYDHRHVFIDPDPDAAASFAERRRLFDTAGLVVGRLLARGAVRGRRGVPRATRSGWSCPRAARELLGLDDERLAPNEVIRAILRAQVDLLWNGGIGTVVKASDESDADAHDRASDAIRVDARELRCRVVGEGGNLGFTRRARVEFSAGGGRIYADFIDNSAGVDCSDHEVNLKILLGLAERRGEMTRAGARRAAGGGHRGRRRSTCSTTRSCRRRSSPRRSTARPGGCSPTRTCSRCSRSAGCSTGRARTCRPTTS